MKKGSLIEALQVAKSTIGEASRYIALEHWRNEPFFGVIKARLVASRVASLKYKIDRSSSWLRDTGELLLDTLESAYADIGIFIAIGDDHGEHSIEISCDGRVFLFHAQDDETLILKEIREAD